MEEIWKDKKDYEGHYQISNLSRIKSIKFGKEIILKQHIRGGYLCVNLSKNGIIKSYYVHRLVAEAFIPNPYNLPEVNHKDECKTNNVVTNLEWCDAKYNRNYGDRLKKVAEKLKNKKDWSKPVLQYTLDGEFVREWPSTREAARNGFNQGNIISCCKGRHKTAHGFIWSYNKF